MKTLTESEAWQEIADRLELIDTVGNEDTPDDSFDPQPMIAGLCNEVDRLYDEGLVTREMEADMRGTAKDLFKPEYCGAYWWEWGVIEPRIVAAQLLALITA